jgi:hypothetical protein
MRTLPGRKLTHFDVDAMLENDMGELPADNEEQSESFKMANCFIVVYQQLESFHVHNEKGGKKKNRLTNSK